MAQVGRISGPLLEANLLRQGIANGTQQNLSFKNTNSDTSLLKIDVANGRIGVDLEAPANEVQVSQTIQTIDVIADTANIGNFNMSNTDINVNSGDLYLNAGEAITLSNLETEQFYVSDNYIATKDTNTNIDLDTNGTGTVEVQSNLNVSGDLFATGDITLDGNIIFGDTGDDSTALTDTVTINSDISSDLLPDVSDTYGVGNSVKQYDEIHTHFINGQLVNSGLVTVNSIAIEARPGNIFFVSANGDNTNVGDHIQGPLATIEEALSRADASTDGPVTIRVLPGVYEENLPLVVPNRVSIIGFDLRNCVVKPAAGSESKDVFHLDDSTLISDLTIKDFQYDSINNTGYAFRFNPGAVITNRSPYVQNITVITSGTVTSASDPRGFDEGDAGRGAWIDGAELDSASIEASMLFHSVTFICPNADVINMTNGVRVEWLNSFTYFANRGLYAFNGVTGRTTYDGSTVVYGAELRSIGSASVYGNYGAVADGADTLMYLVQHNFGYIGAGKFSDNDDSRAIQSQETTELNSGKIHFVTTDHTGSFRIGDNFFIDFKTGNTTVNIDTLTVNQFTGLRVVTGADTTVIDGGFIDTGNLTLTNNTILSRSGDLNVASATGQINLQDNTNIDGNLDISGDLSYGGTLNIKGDEATDSLVFNTQFDQNFNPNLHQTYSLGSFEKKWLNAHLNRLEAGDYSIYDNVIETNVSNANVELRASGTGYVYIPDSATFSNALTINGTTTLNDNVDITDTTFTHTGDTNQTGNFTVSEDVTVNQNLTVGASAEFEEILIDDNFITTTTSNTDLELRASGTGTVNLQENVIVDNNLSANDVTAQQDIDVTLNATADNANIGNVEINDNYIETTSLNGDLILTADRAVFVKGTDTTFGQDLTVSGQTNLNSDVTVTGTITHVGDTSQTGNVTLNGEWTNGDIKFEDNFVTTTQSNSNLELRASGTGEVLIPDNNVQINNDLTVSTDTFLQGTTITGTLTHTGNTIHTGNITQGGELTVDNIYIEDNFITTTSGNLTLGATGDINVDANDVEISQDLTVSGATSLQGTTITGSVTHTGNRTQTGNLDIAGEISNGNILIEDNFISTTATNSDLELRASGTGEVVIDPSDTVTIDNNLFVGGTLDYQGFLTINGNVTLLGNVQDGSLTVTNNFDVTGILDISSQAQFEDIRIEDNFITTTKSNSNLELRASGTGEVLIPNNNVQINNNLFTASISTGDINVNNDLILDELVITDSNIEINENYITTKTSNSNLELRASGSGVVTIQENAVIEQNLTINGTTNLQDANIVGSIVHTGNRTQTGDYNLTGNLNISSIVTDQAFQFDDVRISGNVLETTLSNSNLDLRASGTGEVLLNDNVQINNNLTVSTFNVNSINVATSVDLELVETSTDIQFFDNVITTTNTNSNLELRANGTGSVQLQQLEITGDTIGTRASVDSTLSDITIAPAENLNIDATSALLLSKGTTLDAKNTQGDIRFNTTDNTFEGTSIGRVGFGGVYSDNRLTSVTADPTSDNIRFIIDGASSPLDSTSLVGEITGSGLTIHGLQVDDVLFDTNIVSTNVSNSNLDLVADGTGELVLNDISLKDNQIKNSGNNLIIQSTDAGKVKFGGTFGVAVPFGTTGERPAGLGQPDPQIGDTRWNTTTGLLEIYDGQNYITAAGEATAITPQEFDDLLLEYTLIFG